MACASPASPRTPPAADSRPRTTPPATRQGRRPHPGRTRYRPAQPPPPPHRPEPDLARDRPNRPRPPGLAADARPHRQSPALGTPPTSAPPVLRRRTARHHRPPPAPQIRRPLALDRRDHTSIPTARGSPEPRLTSQFPPLRTRSTHRSRGNRRPPDATAGPPPCPPSGQNTKRPAGTADGPSRKIEAKRLRLTAAVTINVRESTRRVCKCVSRQLNTAVQLYGLVPEERVAP